MKTTRLNLTDIDVYNLTAVEILEHLGYQEPNEAEINSIEQLLKARLHNNCTDLGSNNNKGMEP